MHKALGTEEIKTNPKATAEGIIPSYDAETDTVTTNTKNLTDTDRVRKVIPTVEVKFQDGDHGTVEGDKDQTIDCNDKVTTVPTKKTSDPGYSFIGWKKVGDNTDKIYSSDEIKNMPIDEDTTFVAQWELGKVNVQFKAGSDGSLTVDDANKNQIIDYGTGVSNVPGTEPNRGHEFKGWKRQSDGKIYTEDEIKNMTFTDDDVFEAVFEPIEMSYVVKYVDENGNELHTPKTVTNTPFGTEVTENAEIITGYDVDKDSSTVTIENDGQEIVFTYKLKQLTVTYSAGENGELEGDDSETVTYGGNPENVPIPKADKGYKFGGWTKKVSGGDSSVEDPKGETITEDTVFEAVFVPVHSNYIVKYVDENGNEIFATKQGEETQVGKTVTEDFVQVEGYELISDKSVTIEISENTDENVITFTYRKVEEPVIEEETTTKQEKTTKEKETKKKPKDAYDEHKGGDGEGDGNGEKETPGTTGTSGNNTSMTSPKTGHQSDMLIFMLMFMASMLLAGVSFRKAQK